MPALWPLLLAPTVRRGKRRAVEFSPRRHLCLAAIGALVREWSLAPLLLQPRPTCGILPRFCVSHLSSPSRGETASSQAAGPVPSRVEKEETWLLYDEDGLNDICKQSPWLDLHVRRAVTRRGRIDAAR